MRRARYLLFPVIIVLSVGSFFLWTHSQDDPKVSPKIFSLKPALSFESHEVEGAKLFRARGVETDIVLSSEKISFGFASPIEMKFIGAKRNPIISGEELLEGKSHYLIGNNQSKWKTDIPHVSKVRYHDVYRGIDVVFYGNEGEMEYDFIVKPGADPRQIELAYEDIDSLNIDKEGNAVIISGENKLINRAPKIYQESEGKRKSIGGQFEITSEKHLTFIVAQYDQTQELVIDPVIVWSSYLGGSNYDYAMGIALGPNKEVYIVGKTNGAGFPNINPIRNGFDGTQQRDLFITKLSADGRTVLFSTYIGGTRLDWANGLAVDATGNAFVTGYTYSDDLPVINPYQTGNYSGRTTRVNYGLQNADAYVFKLSSDGSTLLYASYLSGSGTDVGNSIQVDSTGNAYVGGGTNSDNFPTTLGAFQTTHTRGTRGSWITNDAFVVKLSPDGGSLLYATYLGGPSDDPAIDIDIDGQGHAYILGTTDASGFPIVSPLRNGHNGSQFLGYHEGFIAKLNAQGTGLIFSTYLGGSDNDYFEAIAVKDGEIYITGFGSSVNYPMFSSAK